MLRKIEIENFFSIKERQVLNLTIAANATDPDNRFAEPVVGSGERIPRVVTLYGANASGKTTVLKAMVFLRDFLLESHARGEAWISPFSSLETGLAPSRFAIEFDWEYSPDQGRKVFRYELEFEGTSKMVSREALFYWPAKRMRKLFERTQKGIDAGPDFHLPKNDSVRAKVLPTASVIAILSQFNYPWAVRINEAMKAIFSNVTIRGKATLDDRPILDLYAKGGPQLDALNHEIRLLDLGIEAVQSIDTTRGKGLSFVHKGLKLPIDYAFESQGTRGFCVIFPFLWGPLTKGGIAVLDEFDNDIHSLLLPEIIRKFQDPETNPLNAQLIISCHNATLLEHLTKEEVVLTEKDDQGRTKVYRLADVHGVRRDENLYGKYLMGAYGAVPRVA
ncbi:MAG: hypothetical protein A2516_04850 [Alphaproteobacteria bacterium RIFOXYD12_FULL_60_8]|nr:MAG: hypothetical protein A2516_04850 [Alphaproteobacteria bacterium RIFOXYD12_FULL_60_8]